MSRRIVALALCLALVALAACGCSKRTERSEPAAAVTVPPVAAASSTDVASVEDEAESNAGPSVSVMGVEPAAVYRQVSTTRREVALVLEGFTGDVTMDALFALLKSRGVSCVFS